MAKLEFNPDKLLEVDINKITPNGHNPKEKDTKEYQKIVESIKLKGLRGAIVVRNHPHQENYYEVIDGEQRYTAAKELGYQKVYVYNEGAVDDKEAKEMTIWYQQQVPFNRITEAYLVTELIDNFTAEALELPYNEIELKELQDLASFNFDQYNQNNEPATQENLDGTITFSVKLARSDYDIVFGVLTSFAEQHEISTTEALIQIMADIKVEDEVEV